MATMENAATRWATFDCYGTLVDWEQGMQETLQSVIQGDVSALLRRYHELEPEVEAERPFRLYRFVLAKTLKRAAASLKLPLALELSMRWLRICPAGQYFRMLAQRLPRSRLRAGNWLFFPTSTRS